MEHFYNTRDKYNMLLWLSPVVFHK